MPARKKPMPKFGRGSGEPDPIDVLLGAKVRELRKSRGFSQALVAEMIGLTHQQIQKYERGTDRISVSTLLRLCRALDVPASALIAELAGEHAAGEPAPKQQEGSLGGSRARLNLRSDSVRGGSDRIGEGDRRRRAVS
jgi:transcriptional regulator with XRE-family HTH domain